MNRIKIQLLKLSTSRMIGSGIHAHCGIRYAAYLGTLGRGNFPEFLAKNSHADT